MVQRQATGSFEPRTPVRLRLAALFAHLVENAAVVQRKALFVLGEAAPVRPRAAAWSPPWGETARLWRRRIGLPLLCPTWDRHAPNRGGDARGTGVTAARLPSKQQVPVRFGGAAWAHCRQEILRTGRSGVRVPPGLRGLWRRGIAPGTAMAPAASGRPATRVL